MAHPMQHYGDKTLSLDEAIDTVAAQLLANAVKELQWEDMPDIGQHDWEAVVDRARFLAPSPVRFDEAITMLESRVVEIGDDDG
jgi:hypothetical protein